MVRWPIFGIAVQVQVIALAAACRVGAFECSEQADCADAGSAGVCEPEGACSFLDDTCPSGRRYGDRSPGDLAGECVEPDGTTGVASSLSGTSDDDVASSDPSTSETNADDVADTADTGDACPPSWWDCGWQGRIALDLPATAGETLTDVPVLVALGAPRIDPSELSSTGADLRFVTDDEVRVPHEIERWDADGTSIVWISVPTLGPGDGPRLWMYYGNAGVTHDVDPDGVWSGEHAAVWHLNDALDASGHGHDGVVSGDLLDVEGQLGGAKEFFDEDDRIDVPPTAVLDDVFFGGGTVSAWIRPDGYGGGSRGRIAGKTANGPGGWMLYISSEGGGQARVRHGYEGGQVLWFTEGDDLVDDTWYHVTSTFDALTDETPRIYVDGVERTVAVDGAGIDGAPVSDAGLDVVIGNTDVPDRWFDGYIDELRIERTVRTPAWIELQYRSMTDTLVVFSAPERLEDV